MDRERLADLGLRLSRRARRRAAERPARLRRAQELQRATIAFQKLAGLLPERFSYSPETVGGLERIGGAFDYRHRQVVLVRGSIDSRAELEYTLAHELTHALEAQRFHLRLRALTKPGERASVSRALIEGTATLVQYLYSRRYLHDRVPVRQRLSGLASLIAAGPAPYAMNAEATFDYVDGGLFARSLERRAGGWRLVNRALAHHPKQSRDVLHPARWPPSRLTRPVRLGVGPLLGSDWRLVGHGPAGEKDALAILLAGIEEEARSGSAGWNGGRFEVWRPLEHHTSCERPCLSEDVGVIGFRWRERSDSEQFAIAVPAYVIIGLRGERVDDRTWQPLDGGYLSLGTTRHGSALAFAPSAELAGELAQRAAQTAGTRQPGNRP